MSWFDKLRGGETKSNSPVTYDYNYSVSLDYGHNDVKSTPISSGAITIDMLASQSTMVSPTQALKVETFFNCVRDKAETIGAIPLKLHRYERDGKRTLVESGRMHRIFTQYPNDYMTWQMFNEMCVATVETSGAFYAYKVYNSRGNIAELIPFANQRSVTPNMDVYGRVHYTYVTNDGSIVVAEAKDLMIISMFSLNGYSPVNPLFYQASLLGLAKDQENNYSELQKNGITSQMALGTDNVFKDENAIARLKEDWVNARGKNGFKTIPLLENGLKPVNLNLTPAEMDLLKQREFTVDRIHGMTRVPKYRIDMSKSSDKIFELDEAYLRNSLNPILIKIENAINEILRGEYRVTFDRNAFYAGSPWRLVESIDKAVRGGVMSVGSGIRAMGGEPPEGTDDIYVIQSNNAVYGSWSELPSVREQINGGATVPQNNEGNNDDNSN